jgi:hypothetical protein
VAVLEVELDEDVLEEVTVFEVEVEVSLDVELREVEVDVPLDVEPVDEYVDEVSVLDVLVPDVVSELEDVVEELVG